MASHFPPIPEPSRPLSRRKRSSARQECRTEVALSLKTGHRFDGQMTNVSLGGGFLKIPATRRRIKIGDRVELRFIPGQENLKFRCKVARVTDDGVGVQFEDGHAVLGMLVSHKQTLDLLTGVNNALASSLDLQETLETSVLHIRDHLRAEAASLFLIESKGTELVCRACAGPVDIAGLRLKQGEGVIGRAIREGKPVIVHDIESDLSFSRTVDDNTGFRTESLLCAPLKVGDETIGALEVINKRDRRPFSDHDRTVLTALASATALAIRNARQAEALIEKSAVEMASVAKSSFISAMSHELRTPLNGILGYAQLLLTAPQRTLSPKEREYVEHIIRGGDHLLSLINDILDLARIESGRISVCIESFAPADIIAECLAMTRVAAEKCGITVTDETSAVALPALRADPVRLKQILLNLLSNAIKYNRDGGTVTLTAEITMGGKLKIAVTDTGRGIPKSLQSVLFTPFARLGMENHRIEGTGIGLAIAKNLVERMDGCIGFESTEGQGSRFWIELPVAGENPA